MGSLFGAPPAPAPIIMQAPAPPPSAPSGPQPPPGAPASMSSLALVPGETPEERARRLAAQASILGGSGGADAGGDGTGSASGGAGSNSADGAAGGGGAAAP